MTQHPSITVPIALSQTQSAAITLPWFVQRTEYGPEQATYKPLVNGHDAFGALYEAIDKAKLHQQYDANLDASKTVLPEQVPGLKVHVCSLVAPDSPAGSPWVPVYVHSKIMIIDDVFLTHGSANVNRRSMEVDSELNICHERMDVTQPLRRRLWDMHTDGRGAQDDPDIAAKTWEDIVKRNSRNQSGNLSPIASLIGFMWTGKSRLRLD
ncbi:phospholipase D/transphosphatidylase [Caballeronia cordobensis]|uniref:Phospholipase D/transphosphatidylase n=1 Tax=Caballeronia cordobensis TaxID=1353886 RepID=A0A158HFK0_CABCO|nr:phospholipase D/transphosphatidylase [Caballeronia cordobensis]